MQRMRVRNSSLRQQRKGNDNNASGRQYVPLLKELYETMAQEAKSSTTMAMTEEGCSSGPSAMTVAADGNTFGLFFKTLLFETTGRV